MFRDAALDSPDLDARLLVGHALGLDHAALASAADRQLLESEISKSDRFAARRLAHEPVAHILGRKEFWGLELQVNADVLVPRPETETLVEMALAALKGIRNDPLRIADLGTGSGALLIALLHEFPNATGIGTDISQARSTSHAPTRGRTAFNKRSDFARLRLRRSAGRRL